MMRMKILCINSRATDETDFALAFETDEQVLAAWDLLVRRRLINFSYRPQSEGNDAVRSLIERYLAVFTTKGIVIKTFPDTIRRFLPKIYQAELSYDIRELIDPAS